MARTMLLCLLAMVVCFWGIGPVKACSTGECSETINNGGTEGAATSIAKAGAKASATTGPVTATGGAATATAPTNVEGAKIESGAVSIKSEALRDMAVVVSSAVTSALRFKEGAHSDVTDSRVIKVDEILDYLDELEFEEAKRGKGKKGDVKIIDGLIRSQFAKTKQIKFHKSKGGLDPTDFRFMGFLTGIAAVNDATMENVVYAVGEMAMEHGATHLVKIKESATEWGDTTGYAFDLGGFVTSIIGGAGSRAIGPGGTVGAGINGMQGGSADRSDAKFAVFVSNEQLKKVSAEHTK